MESRVLRASLGVAVAALAVTAGASSYSNQGINVTAAPVIVALKDFDQYSGAATLAYTTAARWSPEACCEQITVVIKDVTDGAVSEVEGGAIGDELHLSNRYTELAAGFEGHKLEFTATWNVYNVGGDSGKDTSPKTTYTVPKKEPAPRLDDDPKALARTNARWLVAHCAFLAAAGITVTLLGGPLGGVALGLAAAVFCGAALYEQRLADDPVDLNFRSVAKPRIPVLPKLSAGEGLPAPVARALNDLLAAQAREIGYARAVATAFDRSQGAHVKKATAWEEKQVRASGKYAAQLADALLTEARLWPKVKAALSDSALADATVSYEDALAFGESLVWKGLPRDMSATLTKMGLTKAEQSEVRAQVATIDPGLYDGNILKALPDARDIANMRKLAASMKAFAKKAAKTPLATRPP